MSVFMLNIGFQSLTASWTFLSVFLFHNVPNNLNWQRVWNTDRSVLCGDNYFLLYHWRYVSVNKQTCILETWESVSPGHAELSLHREKRIKFQTSSLTQSSWASRKHQAHTASGGCHVHLYTHTHKHGKAVSRNTQASHPELSERSHRKCKRGTEGWDGAADS